MAKIAARLSNTGNLYCDKDNSIGFSEISQSNISITPNGVFAYTLDEYTGTENSKAMQQLNTGVLKISGVFDEVSGIS
jgi:hypothetical protein